MSNPSINMSKLCQTQVKAKLRISNLLQICGQLEFLLITIVFSWLLNKIIILKFISYKPYYKIKDENQNVSNPSIRY